MRKEEKNGARLRGLARTCAAWLPRRGCGRTRGWLRGSAGRALVWHLPTALWHSGDPYSRHWAASLVLE